MVQPTQLFDTNPGKVTDFSGIPASEIFNSAILPRVNSIAEMLQQDLGGLDAAKQRRDAQLSKDVETELFQQQQDDQFLSQLNQPVSQPAFNMDIPEDYTSPLPAPVSTERRLDPSTIDKEGFAKETLKLSNYGYASDSSPDYNSNVAKIGHANNKLVDGVSAALTKSLAKRYGLKTGDFFEAVTSDGKVLRRRYDDTVPSKYKGRALPETVDLYEQSGSNKFGGKIVGIRVPQKSE